MNLVDKALLFHKRYRWLSHFIYWFLYLLLCVSSSKYADGEKGTYSFEFISDALYVDRDDRSLRFGVLDHSTFILT